MSAATVVHGIDSDGRVWRQVRDGRWLTPGRDEPGDGVGLTVLDAAVLAEVPPADAETLELAEVGRYAIDHEGEVWQRTQFSPDYVLWTSTVTGRTGSRTLAVRSGRLLNAYVLTWAGAL